MLEVRTLNRTLSGRRVLDAVSCSAADGRITGLVGPAGAGKSLLMRTLVGSEPIRSKGAVLYDGMELAHLRYPSSTVGGYMGADSLPDSMTGMALVRYAARIGGSKRSRVSEVVGLVGGAEHLLEPLGECSREDRHRAGIAAAIVNDPDHIILDDPLSELTPASLIWLRGLLRQLADEGKAVMLSADMVSDVELIADDVVVLDRGRVIKHGTMEEIIGSNSVDVLMKTSDDAKMAALLAARNIMAIQTPDGLRISGISTRTAGQLAYANSLFVDSLSEIYTPLEGWGAANANPTVNPGGGNA